MTHTHRRSLIALVGATALWGLSFPLVKCLLLEQQSLVPAAGSWFLSAWGLATRFLLAALVLLPWILKSGVQPDEWKQGVKLAFWCGIGMWLQADGLAHTAASTSAFLTQGYCLLLPLWAAFQQKRNPGPRAWVAVAMVILGGAWISGVTPGNLRLGRGEIETLLAAVFFTFQILGLEDPKYHHNRGLQVAFVMFAAVGALFVPISFATAPTASDVLAVGTNTDVFLLLAGLTLFSTVGAYGLMIGFQRGVTATEAGLIYCAEPVFTALYVLFLPTLLAAWTGNTYANETWTTAMIGGGLLITIANVLMQLRPQPGHDGGEIPHPPV